MLLYTYSIIYYNFDFSSIANFFSGMSVGNKVASAIIISWIASIFTFPIFPLQHWINSRVRWLLRKVLLRKAGLTGRWLAIYTMPTNNGGVNHRIEIVKCSQLYGGEVRGSIRSERTAHKYKFLGRVVLDEFVAHYWATNETRDIGSFKFEIKGGNTRLEGPLTVLDTNINHTLSSIPYKWVRYPSKLYQIFFPVRSDVSPINNYGLFSNQ